MTGMQKVMTAGFCEYFVGKAFPQNTHETLCFAILAYLLHYVFTHTIYISSLPIYWDECFSEKKP